MSRSERYSLKIKFVLLFRQQFLWTFHPSVGLSQRSVMVVIVAIAIKAAAAIKKRIRIIARSNGM